MRSLSRHLFTYLNTAILSLSLTACSSDSPDPEDNVNPITYAVGLSTRASSLYTDKSQIIDFYVHSILSDGTPFIVNDHIIKQDGIFNPEGYVRYWPLPDTKLAFFAVSGINGSDVSWLDNNGVREGVKISGYKVNAKIEDQIDLLVANTGEIISPDKTETSKPLTLTFNHVMSQVVIRARNIDPAIDVEIQGVGLKNINDSGNLNVYLSGSRNGTFEWIPDSKEDDEKKTYKTIFTTSVVINGNIDAKTDNDLIKDLPASDEAVKCTMMMMPQNLKPFDTSTPYGASIMVFANIWNVAKNNGKHEDSDKKIWGVLNSKDAEWMMLPLADTWLPGRRYVYTVTFGGEGSGGFSEDEKGENHDRVLVPVGIEVTVTPWDYSGDIVKPIH